MIWAMNALNDGRAAVAARYLRFPRAAANVAIADSYAVHPWELESLITLLLTTRKDNTSKKDCKIRTLNCSIFETGASLVNSLRSVEDAEYSLFSSREGVFAEMHRIAQRQFAWQRGHFNTIDFYRYSYVYGQDECAEFFRKKYDIELNDFSAVGAALYIMFRDMPELPSSVLLSLIGISPEQTEKALLLLSRDIGLARLEASSLVQETEKKYGRMPIAYLPSVLRRFPIISFGEFRKNMISPLPELIAQRVTSGLYYDIVAGSDNLRNVAAARFEKYCRNILQSCLGGLQVSESYKYRYKKNQIDSPDLFLSSNRVIAVIECKARRLSVGARFAGNPFEQAEREYEEIVKGIFQLWRFFSHERRGIAGNGNYEEDVIGIVITLDSWLQMSRELVAEVLESARARSKAEDPLILPVDQRPIVVCSIEELERTLLSSDENTFVETIKAAVTAEYAGWLLYSVHTGIHQDIQISRPFPFALAEVLPWKEKIDRLAKLDEETS
ncbi:MAG: hypothetical protein FD139_2367 [Methylocystaceae bacterium]|nr:MAG: hypothetical protein FD148_2192 [Methylocystaceae bacterium]KAF0213574.1 MAG: hypothetical protein FD172_486 [Methylocystaceae bacterium]TXT44429.1 MAG: hypothetical protein FD139_2367 [Methylocystaceae bacterium]